MANLQLSAQEITTLLTSIEARQRLLGSWTIDPDGVQHPNDKQKVCLDLIAKLTMALVIEVRANELTSSVGLDLIPEKIAGHKSKGSGV